MLRPSLTTLAVLSLFSLVACSSDDGDAAGSETGGSGGGGTMGGGAGGAGTGGDTPTGGGAGGDGAGGTQPVGDSRFDADALAELEALDVSEYRGKGQITAEETQGDTVRLEFDPASGPICMYGEPFALFYQDRPSDDKLLIMLDGGGACWTGFCFASDVADATLPTPVPAIAEPGAGNLFGDWDVIFVPYCDGSVYSGDGEVVEADGRTRYHHGRQNLTAAFDTALEQFPNAREIVLAGFSAGGFGTIAGAVAARIAFPQADIYIVNDSGPGVQNLADTTALDTRLTEWAFDKVIPESCTACNGGRGQLTEMIAWTLEHDPTMKVSMLSYLGDNVIGDTFLGLANPDYEALLLGETDKVNAAYPDRFKRFMLPGDGHVLQGAYTTLTVGGVLEKDWVEAMVTGDDAVWTDLVEPTP